MANIIFVLTVLLIASSASYIFRKSIEECIAIAFFLIIIILYISGIVFNLIPGLFLILGISLISGILFIFFSIKDKYWFQSYVLTPGLLVFIVFVILFWWSTRGRVYSAWDEFSHWGLVIKNMYSLNDFGTGANATTIFKGYPPASSLLAYYYTKLAPQFQENYTMRSMNLFMISFLLPVFKNVTFREKSKILYLFLICFCLPLYFNQEVYTTIYVDTLLGIMFFYLLYSYIEKKESFQIVSLALSSFVLSITKATGLGLSCIAATIIIIDGIFQYRKQKQWNYHIFIAAISILFTAITGNLSWKYYLKSISTPEAWNTKSINLNNILTLFTSDIAEYQKETLSVFWDSMQSIVINGNVIDFTVITWTLIFALLVLILCKYADHFEEKLLLICVNCGIVIYSLALLLLYLFTYSEYEAVRVASFSRYMSTYLLGVLIIYVFLYIKKFNRLINIKFITLIILFNVNWFNPLVNMTLLASQTAKQTQELRNDYSKLKDVSNTMDFEKDKIFFVCQNDTGRAYYVARYEVTPILMDQEAWSLGSPYYDGDVWTVNYTPDQLEEVLIKGNYTYVYLYKIDEQFISNYKSLFIEENEIAAQTLYKIIIKDHNKILLKKFV